MGHCLVLLAIQLYTWFLRMQSQAKGSEVLALFLFIMVIFPCLLTGLFLFFDALPRYRQRQISAVLAIMGMNSALMFLEPDDWPELILWAAWAGYAGMLIGGTWAFWEDGGQAQIKDTQEPNTQGSEESQDAEQLE
ncbi:hypothetical protein KC357_g3916 [Hortaea werneckii]|nr:hypothetical protein KC357_g3916 [Hortaea werneckii]